MSSNRNQFLADLDAAVKAPVTHMPQYSKRYQFPGTLSGNQLKAIAFVCMLIDHIGIKLVTNDTLYLLCRCIGRVSFPIFAYLLVEGHYHTHNWKKYCGRLFFIALLSEIPFNILVSGKVFYPDHQNTIFLLLLGFLMLMLLSNIRIRFRYRLRRFLNHIVLAAFMSVAVFFHLDYDIHGILLIYLFYQFRKNRILALLLSVLVMLPTLSTFKLLPGLLVSFVLISMYSGKKGKKTKGIQKFFYFVYPVHLLLIDLVSVL